VGKSLDLGKIARALSDRAELFEGAVVKVGIPAGKTYPDGTSVAYVAAIQEFGAAVPAHTITAKGGALAFTVPHHLFNEGELLLRKRVNIPAFNIPARPAFRLTRAARSHEWAKLMGEGAEAVVKRKISLEGMLDAVGAVAAGDIVQTIANRVDPPLAPSTVEGRIRRAQAANPKFGAKSVPASISQPLNDSGALVAHISYGTGKAGETFEGGTPVKG
jgi:hypothetical protein